MDDARVFRLVRDVPGSTDETAFTGIVADAIVFPDGVSVLHWRTVPASTEVYPSAAALRQVREMSGRSHFEEY